MASADRREELKRIIDRLFDDRSSVRLEVLFNQGGVMQVLTTRKETV